MKGRNLPQYTLFVQGEHDYEKYEEVINYHNTPEWLVDDATWTQTFNHFNLQVTEAIERY